MGNSMDQRRGDESSGLDRARAVGRRSLRGPLGALVSIVALAAGCHGASVVESRGDEDVGEAEQEAVAATCFTISRGGAWQVQDAYTHSGNANTNYGAADSLVVGPSSISLAKFDLSGFPAGAT